jgi:predicted amidophosphoribosyltransferase
MNCERCTKHLETDWKFCPECGVGLQGESTEKVVERRKGALGLLFASGPYGSGVRQQVFEVIVRQAVAGAPWKEVCAQPMAINNISVEEIEEEVERRRGYLH